MPVEKGSLLRKEGGLGSILGHCIVGRIYLKLFPSTSSSKPRLTLLLLSTSFAHGVLFAGRSCLCCVSLTSIVHFNGGKWTGCHPFHIYIWAVSLSWQWPSFITGIATICAVQLLLWTQLWKTWMVVYGSCYVGTREKPFSSRRMLGKLAVARNISSLTYLNSVQLLFHLSSVFYLLFVENRKPLAI